MAKKNTIKAWAVVWKDNGNVVKAMQEDGIYFQIFRTRSEARRHCGEDRKVVRIEFSMRVI